MTATLNALPPVRPDWLARHHEPALEPGLPIVDPHHHLLDRPEHGTYLLPNLLADLGSGHDVRATVYVEWQSMYRADGPPEMRPVGEVEFANGVAAMAASGRYGPARACAGIIGHADLTLGARLAPVLDAMAAAAGERFRGVRFIAASDPDQHEWGAVVKRPPGLLREATVREAFALLAPRGLCFDTWIFHPQLGDLADLARAFPDTRICLDHIGGPIALGRFRGRHDEVFADWRRSLRELAACPNVHVKLGGMGMKLFGFGFHEREHPPDSETLATAWRPWVETCIEIFGPARAMFESNFPVDKAAYGYGVFWNACKRLAHGLSEGGKADLFHGTASRFYGLGPLPPAR